VFDRNTAAIKYYEKTGFIKNPAKTSTFHLDAKIWTAFEYED